MPSTPDTLPDPPDPAQAWLAAARDPSISLELEAIYQMVADQITARAPICRSSGRCCSFEKFGHRLYVTGLEAAYTLTRLPSPVTNTDIAAARLRGDCPFLIDKLCSVHTIKPLGCRIYFCDETSHDRQQDLSERALEQVRRLHDRRDIPYHYGEWRLDARTPDQPRSRRTWRATSSLKAFPSTTHALGIFGAASRSAASTPVTTRHWRRVLTPANREAHAKPANIPTHLLTPRPWRRASHPQLRVAIYSQRSLFVAAAGLSCHTIHAGSNHTSYPALRSLSARSVSLRYRKSPPHTPPPCATPPSAPGCRTP